MKKDLIESIIMQKRDELDHVEKVPLEAIWEGIQQGERGYNRHRWIILYSIAATLLLLILAIAWFFKTSSIQSSSPENITIAQYYPNWAPQENQYINLVHAKKSELNFDQLDKKAYAGIFQELSELEDFYRESMHDLTLYEDKEAIIRVLIKYHERQLKLLERLSYEIQKKDDYENQEIKPFIF